MLSFILMSEAAKRARDPWAPKCLLTDCIIQAAYCLDAPDEVQVGVFWHEDECDAECSGVAKRIARIRETAV